MTDMEALGRRWVALGLEWMPGMRVWRGERESPLRMCRERVGNQLVARVDGPANPGTPVRYIYQPDFADKLTELALLHYVQQAWADPRAYVLPLAGLHTDGRWAVVGNPPPGVLERMAAEGYPTWAEACIAALEAAKEVTT